MTPLAAVEALCTIHSPQAVLTTGGAGEPVSIHICHGCGERFPCTSRRVLDEVTPE
jgi:hypothetical protein